MRRLPPLPEAASRGPMPRYPELAGALAGLIFSGGILSALGADSPFAAGNEILARVETGTLRRHILLKQYSVSRQYTMENLRFGKHASVAVLMTYHVADGDSYTVLTRSGSDKLNSIIDQVLESETNASVPAENARRQITPANYRARLVGSEVAAGRSCYVLELVPRFKYRFLIVGKVWVDTESDAVIRIEGQFAASMSMLVGTPHIAEEFMEVSGYWLPAHVRSVTSSFLLGPTELDILFSNYQFDRDPGPQ